METKQFTHLPVCRDMAGSFVTVDLCIDFLLNLMFIIGEILFLIVNANTKSRLKVADIVSLNRKSVTNQVKLKYS